LKKQAVHLHNRLLGKWGEDCALSFLEHEGFQLVDRNVQTADGEIDLIVQKNGELVFCEVKTRSDNMSGYPEEAVTDDKMEHILNSAECYLDLHPEYVNNWRVDVIAITGMIHDPYPQIEWFENAD
jgi:putative endonuclease